MTTPRTRRAAVIAAVAIASLLSPAADQALAADCTRTFTGRTPLSDMTPGQTYLGAPGGLYPGVSNQRPAAHNGAGLNIATNQVRPRTPSGAIDPANGLVGMISIGMSNTTQEFSHWRSTLAGDPTVHPRLRIVDGAQGGKDAIAWSSPSSPTWQVLASRLANAGVAPAQVQTLWLKQQIRGDNLAQFGPFPASARGLQDYLRTIVQIARQKYPNLRLAYLSSRTYGDYGSAARGLGAYESAFSVKWLVQEQINGGLPYAGPGAVAPWLSWGPYLWADGLGSDRAVGGVPGRSDGLEWRCADFNTDGIHPSTSGRQKVATMLDGHFRTDATATPWFLAP
jgi:hypothetical protein